MGLTNQEQELYGNPAWLKANILLSQDKYEDAAAIIIKLANNDFVPAQYKLGILYDYGKGVGQSDTNAFKWYLKAAENGNVDAMNDLAVCYKTGQGCTASLEKALIWYEKAALGGNVDAKANLGINLMSIYKNNRIQLAYQNQHLIVLKSAYKWILEAHRAGNIKASQVLPSVLEEMALEGLLNE